MLTKIYQPNHKILTNTVSVKYETIIGTTISITARRQNVYALLFIIVCNETIVESIAFWVNKLYTNYGLLLSINYHQNELNSLQVLRVTSK